MSLSPTALSFDYTPGVTFTDTQNVTLFSTGASVPFFASLNASDAASNIGANVANWLSIQPSSGATPAILKVTVNPTNLQPGIYTGSVLVTQNIDLRPLVVQVKLTVRQTGVALKVQPELRLVYDLDAGGDSPKGTVQVDSTTQAPVRFTV